MKHMKVEEILDHLAQLFPDAHCELVHHNAYEMAVAVILSAQTTDASVNKITPALFQAYPTIQSMAESSPKEIEQYIKTLGLYRNKAKSIHGFAKAVVERYGGVIPSDMDELTTLPGVGRKCANVIQSECFDIPALAVDTHVSRISKRLGLAYQKDTVDDIERKLKRKIPEEKWIQTHHQMIFFGRYQCKAQRPLCDHCPFIEICHEKKKHFVEK